MAEAGADYTNTFRALADGQELEWMAGNEAFTHWHARWTSRLSHESLALMQAVNPAIIPRNYYVDEALRLAEMGDMSKFDMLLAALQNPFEVNEATKHLTNPPDNCGPHVTYCGT